MILRSISVFPESYVTGTRDILDRSVRGHALVTTLQRVKVEKYFTAMCYNFVRARFLDRIA